MELETVYNEHNDFYEELLVKYKNLNKSIKKNNGRNKQTKFNLLSPNNKIIFQTDIVNKRTKPEKIFNFQDVQPNKNKKDNRGGSLNLLTKNIIINPSTDYNIQNMRSNSAHPKKAQTHKKKKNPHGENMHLKVGSDHSITKVKFLPSTTTNIRNKFQSKIGINNFRRVESCIRSSKRKRARIEDANTKLILKQNSKTQNSNLVANAVPPLNTNIILETPNKSNEINNSKNNSNNQQVNKIQPALTLNDPPLSVSKKFPNLINERKVSKVSETSSHFLSMHKNKSILIKDKNKIEEIKALVTQQGNSSNDNVNISNNNINNISNNLIENKTSTLNNKYRKHILANKEKVLSSVLNKPNTNNSKPNLDGNIYDLLNQYNVTNDKISIRNNIAPSMKKVSSNSNAQRFSEKMKESNLLLKIAINKRTMLRGKLKFINNFNNNSRSKSGVYDSNNDSDSENKGKNNDNYKETRNKRSKNRFGSEGETCLNCFIKNS